VRFESGQAGPVQLPQPIAHICDCPARPVAGTRGGAYLDRVICGGFQKTRPATTSSRSQLGHAFGKNSREQLALAGLHPPSGHSNRPSRHCAFRQVKGRFVAEQAPIPGEHGLGMRRIGCPSR
jgi:hypothetical protein